MNTSEPTSQSNVFNGDHWPVYNPSSICGIYIIFTILEKVCNTRAMVLDKIFTFPPFPYKQWIPNPFSFVATSNILSLNWIKQQSVTEHLEHIKMNSLHIASQPVPPSDITNWGLTSERKRLHRILSIWIPLWLKLTLKYYFWIYYISNKMKHNQWIFWKNNDTRSYTYIFLCICIYVHTYIVPLNTISNILRDFTERNCSKGICWSHSSLLKMF